jgi:Na+-transporting methylmalonyl-CoA/oxaloacetate decarboxylase gamma subunit
MLGGAFYLTTVGPLMVIFVSFLAAYVLPLIGNVLIKRSSAEAGVTHRAHAAARADRLRADRMP